MSLVGGIEFWWFWSLCKGVVATTHLFKNWSSRTYKICYYQPAEEEVCSLSIESYISFPDSCQSWMFCFLLLLALKGIWKLQEWSIGKRLLKASKSKNHNGEDFTLFPMQLLIVLILMGCCMLRDQSFLG